MFHLRGKLARTSAIAAVTAAILVCVSACASSSSSSSSSNPNAAATVSYAYWDSNMTPAYQAAAKAFTAANPNIKIDLRLVPFASYFTKLNTQVQSKSAPDVFWVQNIQFPLYAENGALADLTPYQKASKADLSGIPSSAMKTFVLNGKQMALPWQAITFGLYYNKNLFKAAGVADPTNQWTWDDVATAAAKLTNHANGTYGIVSPVWNYGGFYQTMLAYGAKIVTDGGKSTDFASPAAIKGIDFWAQLSRNGYSPSVAQLTDTTPDQWFQSGKIAMESTGSWNASVFAKSMGANVGIVQEPTATVNTSGAATTADAVSANSKHPAQAYKWAEFLSAAQGQKILNSVAGGAAGAPVNAAADDTWLKGVGNPDAKVFLDEINRTTPLPATKNTAAWENQETTTLAPAWNGQSSTADVAKNMAEIIKKALAAE